jgi:hypothetical protein
MKKILIYCDDFYPNNTGYANAFRGLIKSIIDSSEDELYIEVFTSFPLGNNQELKEKNLKVRRLNRIKVPVIGFIVSSVYNSILINKYFFKNKFDLLFVETFDNVFFLSFLSKKICDHTLVRAHSTSDTEYTFYVKTLKYKLRKFLLINVISKKIKYFGATNNFHIDFIKKYYLKNNIIDVSDKFFFVIPNSVHIEKYTFDLKEENHEKIKLLILGRMDYLGFNQKGFLDFFISLNLLQECELNKFEINIVGSGNKLQYVKELSKKYDNIQFYENLTHVDCIDLLTEMDLVVLPSRYEGLSMFALESIALGKICLFSKTGGLVDLINENGYLYTPHSYYELSNSLKKIISLNRTELNQMKKKSLDLYNDKFSSEQVYNKFSFAFNIITLLK